ncbi:hypothetical protein BV20DRAFT_545453 [Pilatotrama ljubarskyi]|nr:hypothetical protein BV20DRAFT_545453 [Pilatotrama ljubarskyi]
MGIAWSRLMRLWWSARDDTSTEVVTPEPAPAPDLSVQKEKEPPSGPSTMELRLMVETDTPSSPSILVDGKHWTLSEPFDIESGAPLPYVCVSYVWGQGRAPNPIHPSITMSDRTLSTFTAAARCVPGHPIWVDAFCVPVERMKKRATLESLGFIFGRCKAVVAVLARKSMAAVEEMDAFLKIEPRPQEVPAGPLEALEADEWIRSVWTYQEIVNCPSLLFVSQDREGSEPQKAISGSDLLSTIGNYLDRWGRAGRDGRKILHGIRNIYPHADDFQDLLADWMTSDYATRAALKIMAGMNERTHIAPANYFYSMIGALTTRPSARGTNPSIEELAELFMQLCEQKGDYSFIFSPAPRDSRRGLRWRPIPCLLRSILAWHIVGEGQNGERVEGGALLKDVFVLSISGGEKMSQHTQDFFRRSVGNFAEYFAFTEGGPERTSLEERGYGILKALKFSGDGGWYTTEAGVFYPQTQLRAGAAITVCIAQGVRWVFGAPAMAAVTMGSEDDIEYAPGIFIGDLDRSMPKTTFLMR